MTKRTAKTKAETKRPMTPNEKRLYNKLADLNSKRVRKLSELLALRKKIAYINETNIGDHEKSHRLVDEALLDYIGDAEVRKLFDAVSRWYA